MPKALEKDIRNRIVNLYKQGLKITEISKIINKPYPTITYILKQEVGYSNKRPSQGNINYFSTIDTHSKAYILGYIAADGCISLDNKGLYRLAINCNTKDKCIFDFIKSEICFETKITDKIVKDKRSKNLQYSTRLSLGNQILCKNLLSLGITPQKTFTLKNFLLNIPKEFRKSAILGYFDGDGHVSGRIDKRVKNPNYRTYHISICGTEAILKGIAEELQIERFNITVNDTWSEIKICNKKDFYNFYGCYENLMFFLKRKHCVFLERINYERTISSS